MTQSEPRLSKRHFTVNERVLLHLKECGSVDQTMDISALITQNGIAAALGIRINHVSRAVKTLQKQGFLRQATARVKGEIRRRKVYLITEDGMSVANKIFNRIANTFVSVRDSRQRIRETPANNVKTTIPQPRTYTAILEMLDNRNVLDLHKLKEKRKRKVTVSRYYGVPEEAPLYGRNEELKKLRSWLQLKKPLMMTVTGDQGIGKTALAMHAVKSIVSKRPLFWYTCTADSTVEKMLNSLSKFFMELGKTELSAMIGKGHIDNDALKNALTTSFTDFGGVVVLDGISPESDEISELARIVSETATTKGNQVLVTTREIPPWKSTMKRRGILGELKLAGLDEDSCRKIASNLDEKEFAKAYRLARGNPLEIKLLSEYADEDVDSKKLTPEERALLRYLKVVHHPRTK